MPMINEIADTFHELPGEMFCWGYGSDGIAVNALDTAYSRMERLDEKLRKWKIEEGFQWAVFFNYLNLLEMPYDQFVKELDSMSRQTGIVFDPDRKQMMRS